MNANYRPPSSQTQGKNMFNIFLLGYFGRALQIVGIIGLFTVFVYFMRGSEHPFALCMLAVLCVGSTIMGAYLHFISKQTVQIGGKVQTKGE